MSLEVFYRFQLTFSVIKVIKTIAINVEYQAILAITYFGHGSGLGRINLFDKVFNSAEILNVLEFLTSAETQYLAWLQSFDIQLSMGSFHCLHQYSCRRHTNIWLVTSNKCV